MLTPAERELLAAVHKWARTHGWAHHRLGWANAELAADATLAIRHDAGSYGLAIYHRNPGGTWPTSGTYWPVDSVRQAVDVLCALGVLPAWLSSQWQAGALAGVQLTELQRDRYWTHGCGADVLRKDAELIARRAAPA